MEENSGLKTLAFGPQIVALSSNLRPRKSLLFLGPGENPRSQWETLETSLVHNRELSTGLDDRRGEKGVKNAC
jgi:hypothetical protein